MKLRDFWGWVGVLAILAGLLFTLTEMVYYGIDKEMANREKAAQRYMINSAIFAPADSQ